jgi:hypothetical protein
MYNTYRFSEKEKDPVIDIARTCVEIFAGTRGISFNKALKLISKESGVTVSCMTNWFYGNVRKPFFCTVVAVVHATGREIAIGGHGVGSKTRFRVIKGSKAA